MKNNNNKKNHFRGQGRQAVELVKNQLDRHEDFSSKPRIDFRTAVVVSAAGGPSLPDLTSEPQVSVRDLVFQKQGTAPKNITC